MAQNSWDFPLGADFIDAQAAMDGGMENLRTNHSGTSAPTDTDDYMWWVDTTNSVVKMENGAGGWYTMFSLAANGGLLPIDGTSAMTGDLDMNGAGDIIIDADADSKLVCDTDDELSLELGGAEECLFTATYVDFKANYLRNMAMTANTATPSGATSQAVELKDSSGTSVWVPGYAAQWT
jgi:hypothetical protein